MFEEVKSITPPHLPLPQGEVKDLTPPILPLLQGEVKSRENKIPPLEVRGGQGEL